MPEIEPFFTDESPRQCLPGALVNCRAVRYHVYRTVYSTVFSPSGGTITSK